MYRFHPFSAISKKINLHVTEINESVNNFFFTSNLCKEKRQDDTETKRDFLRIFFKLTGGRE